MCIRDSNNAGGYYKGLCTVREAIEVSSNVVNAKILTNVEMCIRDRVLLFLLLLHQ